MDLARLGRQKSDISIPFNSISLCMISKDEHQKEKLRWQTKITELEEMLRKAEENNSQLVQQKAETNKRIQEMEKAQKTLMKSNKKYQEKIRTVVAFETKHYEDKVKQLQEDLAMTKQCMDKISAECCRLKQRKMTADKEEELVRLRSLNVQYCKTIAAYKQLVSDKERKVEVLLRVINRTRKNNPSFNWHELDYQSAADSVFSLSSSQSFDGLGDDQTQGAKSPHPKSSSQVSRKWNEENGGPEQSAAFPSNASQSSVESGWEEERQKLWALVKEMRDRISVLQPSREKQQIQIEDLLEANELLEFRLLELENCPSVLICQKCSVPTSETSVNVPDDCFLPLELGPTYLPIDDLLERLSFLQNKHFMNDDDRSVCAMLLERLRKQKEEVEASRSKLESAERKLIELEAQLECSDVTMESKNKECQTLKRNVDELKVQEKQLRNQMKDVENFSKILTEKLKDMVNKYNDAMKFVSELQKDVNSKKNNERMLSEKLKWLEIAQQVSRIELVTTRKRQSSDGTSLKEKMVGLLKHLGTENRKLREELNELKMFNEQLEGQIELRNEAIVDLKSHLNSSRIIVTPNSSAEDFF